MLGRGSVIHEMLSEMIFDMIINLYNSENEKDWII